VDAGISLVQGGNFLLLEGFSSFKKAQDTQNNISLLCFLCFFVANISKMRIAAKIRDRQEVRHL
jgi:hypothetical protein